MCNAILIKNNFFGKIIPKCRLNKIMCSLLNDHSIIYTPPDINLKKFADFAL